LTAAPEKVSVERTSAAGDPLNVDEVGYNANSKETGRTATIVGITPDQTDAN